MKLTTIKFLYKLLFGKANPAVFAHHKVIQSNGQELLFEEASPNKNKLGTIIFTHGLSENGYHDEMTNKLANALVQIGYQVILPHFKRLCEYDISPAGSDDVLISIQTLLKNGYATDNTVAIFAVSFSGPYVLKAACDITIAGSISSILLLGSPFSYKSIVNYQFDESVKPNLFVRMILAMNLQEYGLPEPVRLASRSLISELSRVKSIENINIDKFNLDSKQKYILNELVNGLENGEIKKTLCQSKIKSFDQHLGLEKSINNLEASVTIIQGDQDDVIPMSEGNALYDMLVKKNIKTYLTITPLISHVRHRLSVNYFFKGNEMLKAFCFYFESINSRARSSDKK